MPLRPWNGATSPSGGLYCYFQNSKKVALSCCSIALSPPCVLYVLAGLGIAPVCKLQ
jgi:hypothetical protein